MMKKYTALEMEIVVLEECDIVRTSGGKDIDLGENELPLVPVYN